ncbi:serine/threonine-protein kinase [Blastococcus sp. SYSU D00820]
MEFREFGPYRIEELLGRGGMGEVYRAFDTEHQRTVALKVLTESLAADRSYRERFRREAYAAARLSEPHIVPIHRYGEIDGRLFLDMRLVRGRDLAAVISEDGPLAPPRAVSIVGQVAHALDAAHTEGLVHRDVKPSNVLVCSSTGDADPDDDEFVYLVDFGIARAIMDDELPALTQVGSAVGSFDYMAPERFLEQPADARSDVYSLACVLFESLTGRRPFTVTDLAPLMWAHLNETPPAVSVLRPDVPAALDEVVAKGLAKDPEERWRSAGALASAARRALTTAGLTPRSTVVPPPVTDGARVPAQAVGLSDPGRPMPPPGPDPAATVGAPAPTPAPAPIPPPSGRGSSASGLGTSPGGDPGGSPSTTVLPQVPPPAPFGPGPGGPGGTGEAGVPPAAGGDGKRSRGPRVATALVWAAAALVAVLTAVLVLVQSGSESSAQQPPDPPTEGPQHDDLLAILPADYSPEDCEPAPPADDGEVAAVDCGPSATQPGPMLSRFYLYPDGDMADRAFRADVGRLGLPELPADTVCPSSQGYYEWSLEDIGSGQVACYVDQENDAVLIWTETEDGVEGIVRIRDGGTQGLVQLAEWWNDTDVATFGS